MLVSYVQLVFKKLLHRIMLVVIIVHQFVPISITFSRAFLRFSSFSTSFFSHKSKTNTKPHAPFVHVRAPPIIRCSSHLRNTNSLCMCSALILVVPTTTTTTHKTRLVSSHRLQQIAIASTLFSLSRLCPSQHSSLLLFFSAASSTLTLFTFFRDSLTLHAHVCSSLFLLRSSFSRRSFRCTTHARVSLLLCCCVCRHIFTPFFLQCCCCCCFCFWFLCSCVCVCCCCYFIAITRRSSALKLRLWRKKWLSLSTASRRRLLGHLGKAQISGLGMLEKYNNYFFTAVLCLLFVDLNLTCQHKQKIIQGFLLKSFFKISTLIWIYIIKILAVSIVLF